MKKKILFLPRWYPNKEDVQLGTFIRQQALLMKDDFDISVIYVQADASATQKFSVVENKKDGIHELIVYFKNSAGPIRKIVNARRYKKAQAIAFKKLAYMPHLCHVHVPYRSALLAVDLHRRHRIPFVITEHWSGHLTGEFLQKRKFDKILYRSVLEKAAAISCVSERLQKCFKANTGFDSVVIPNYIESSPASLPGRNKSATIEILSVSDMTDPVKNISGLVKAFSAAVNQNPLLRLTIVGGGPDEEKIHQLVKSLHLESSVILKGRLPHNEVLNALHHCDFYVCNSSFETFGMTVAEALRTGKPVISTMCGGPEEFLHEQNSIRIETNNQHQLTNALLKMSAEFQNYHPQKIAEETELKFGGDAVRQKWISFYNNALQG